MTKRGVVKAAFLDLPKRHGRVARDGRGKIGVSAEYFKISVILGDLRVRQRTVAEHRRGKGVAEHSYAKRVNIKCLKLVRAENYRLVAKSSLKARIYSALDIAIVISGRDNYGNVRACSKLAKKLLCRRAHKSAVKQISRNKNHIAFLALCALKNTPEQLPACFSHLLRAALSVGSEGTVKVQVTRVQKSHFSLLSSFYLSFLSFIISSSLASGVFSSGKSTRSE